MEFYFINTLQFMAEDKKSFVLYADLIHTVKKMPKEKQGDLFMTILAYVNDENPVVDDLLIDLVFEPIKRQMKRDLVKYETAKEKRREAGRLAGLKSGEARKVIVPESNQCEPMRTNGSNCEPNEHVNVNATVNGNVTVKEINNNIDTRKLKFAQSLIPFVSIYGNELIRNFCDYWSEPNKSNTKFRQELEKTWDTERRLKTWNQNNFSNNSNNKKQTQDELTRITNEIRERHNQ